MPLAEPEISISEIYFWYSLDHVAVDYGITANDGENLVSSVTVTSVADPTMSVGCGSLNGAGDKTGNADTTGKLAYMSTDEWTAEVTLSYTLGGVSRTKTLSLTKQPQFLGFIWDDAFITYADGTISGKTVDADVKITWETKDRHDIEAEITGVKLGWMIATPSGYGYDYTPVGNTRVIWDGTGTSPVTPDGPPLLDGDYTHQMFKFSDVIDVTPDASASTATHFYLIFDIEGTGTDSTDGTVYEIVDPVKANSSPYELSTASYTDPEISYTGMNYWPFINHAEVEYVITLNDADASSMVSEVSAESSTDPSYSFSAVDIPGYDTVKANVNTTGQMANISGDYWTASISAAYTIGGSSAGKSISVTDMPDVWPYDMACTFGTLSGTTDNANIGFEINFSFDENDRHDYDIDFTDAVVEWYREEGGSYVSLGEASIWDGLDPSPYYGPYPYTGVGTKCLGYSFWIENVDLTPPEPSATHFRLRFAAEGTGTDSYDGSDYSFDPDALTGYSDYLALP